MRVCFISHGSSGVGMGHVMRSLALAGAFRDRGYDVCFFSKYRQGASIIKEKGFSVVEYEKERVEKDLTGFHYGDQKELHDDIEWIAAAAPEMWDIMVVDSYNVSWDFFTELKKYAQCLVYIDDLNAFHYPVDVILNGTASAENMCYEKLQSAKLLLGVQYNLLRREFSNLSGFRNNKNIENILITTGNSDPFHVTEKLLEVLLEEKDLASLQYHVIVGSGFGKEIWSDSAASYENVILYDRPGNMAEIMKNCDIAVAAGGSTLYELAACGIPTVAFSYAENQIPQMQALSDMGLLECVGTHTDLNSETIIGFIRRMRGNVDMYRELIQRLQKLVDGKGAQRAVQKIEKFCVR